MTVAVQKLHIFLFGAFRCENAVGKEHTLALTATQKKVLELCCLRVAFEGGNEALQPTLLARKFYENDDQRDAMAQHLQAIRGQVGGKNWQELQKIIRGYEIDVAKARRRLTTAQHGGGQTFADAWFEVLEMRTRGAILKERKERAESWAQDYRDKMEQEVILPLLRGSAVAKQYEPAAGAAISLLERLETEERGKTDSLIRDEIATQLRQLRAAPATAFAMTAPPPMVAVPSPATAPETDVSYQPIPERVFCFQTEKDHALEHLKEHRAVCLWGGGGAGKLEMAHYLLQKLKQTGYLLHSGDGTESVRGALDKKIDSLNENLVAVFNNENHCTGTQGVYWNNWKSRLERIGKYLIVIIRSHQAPALGLSCIECSPSPGFSAVKSVLERSGQWKDDYAPLVEQANPYLGMNCLDKRRDTVVGWVTTESCNISQKIEKALEREAQSQYSAVQNSVQRHALAVVALMQGAEQGRIQTAYRAFASMLSNPQAGGVSIEQEFLQTHEIQSLGNPPRLYFNQYGVAKPYLRRYWTIAFADHTLGTAWKNWLTASVPTADGETMQDRSDWVAYQLGVLATVPVHGGGSHWQDVEEILNPWASAAEKPNQILAARAANQIALRPECQREIWNLLETWGTGTYPKRCTAAYALAGAGQSDINRAWTQLSAIWLQDFNAHNGALLGVIIGTCLHWVRQGKGQALFEFLGQAIKENRDNDHKYAAYKSLFLSILKKKEGLERFPVLDRILDEPGVATALKGAIDAARVDDAFWETIETEVYYPWTTAALLNEAYKDALADLGVS